MTAIGSRTRAALRWTLFQLCHTCKCRALGCSGVLIGHLLSDIQLPKTEHPRYEDPDDHQPDQRPDCGEAEERVVLNHIERSRNQGGAPQALGPAPELLALRRHQVYASIGLHLEPERVGVQGSGYPFAVQRTCTKPRSSIPSVSQVA